MIRTDHVGTVGAGLLTKQSVTIVRQVRLDRRPLLETAVDADLFVDRDQELDRLLRALELGLNAAVGGPDGSGRTSLLRRLVFRLRALDRPTVFVGASGLDSPE